jgi:hypothetical protein
MRHLPEAPTPGRQPIGPQGGMATDADVGDNPVLRPPRARHARHASPARSAAARVSGA